MASSKTGIEWTDRTWGPVIGCRKIAAGCKSCYAETMSKRLAAMGQKDYASILTPEGKFNGRAITRPETLAEPLRWRKPRMVFVNSMSDLFHEDVPFEFIAAVFGVMAACPQHTFQVLTKRPARALEFFEWCKTVGSLIRDKIDFHARKAGAMECAAASAPLTVVARFAKDWPLKNVWLGVSAAHQPDADALIPILLKCPAAVRFVSAEPLIGPVDLSTVRHGNDPDLPVFGTQWGLDWVIVGGESGPGARPCDVAWIRSIVEQCKSAGVPCFVKQLGARPDALMNVDFPNVAKAWSLRGERPGDPVLSYGPILKDRKGGDPSEWPEDLRVREFPKSNPETHTGKVVSKAPEERG